MPVEVRRGDFGQTFAVIVGPAGRARRFIVIEDLSEIASVDKRRRDFVANASHELQTPIAALVGMLELLEQQHAGALAHHKAIASNIKRP